MPADTAIIDFDNAKSKQMLFGWLKSLKGPHRVKIGKVRNGRSLHQNAYLWGVIYPAMVRGITDTWGEEWTPEELHEWCKATLLTKPIVNRKTGEHVGDRPGSSAALDTKEFSTYVDNLKRIAAEYFNIDIPEAERFAERPATASHGRRASESPRHRHSGSASKPDTRSDGTAGVATEDGDDDVMY